MVRSLDLSVWWLLSITLARLGELSCFACWANVFKGIWVGEPLFLWGRSSPFGLPTARAKTHAQDPRRVGPGLLLTCVFHCRDLDGWFGFGFEPLAQEKRVDGKPLNHQTTNPNTQFEGSIPWPK